MNASFEPLKVVSWQKAIVLWFQGKVEVVEYHERVVRSVSAVFKLPSVIRLKAFVRSRPRLHVRFSRENIYLRDEHKCQYCCRRYPTKELTLDHVIPVSKGGPKSWLNVVTACRGCNQRKRNRTPEQAEMPLLRAPSIPKWLPSNDIQVSFDGVPESWLIYLGALEAQLTGSVG